MEVAESKEVLGTTLILVLIVVLLFVPLFLLGLGILRRSIARSRRVRSESDPKSYASGGWDASARRTKTPSADEIEAQFGKPKARGSGEHQE